MGWNTWEEIERLQNPTAAVRNFGWPCYEGSGRQSGYDSANLSICENLYARAPALSKRRCSPGTTRARSSRARAARPAARPRPARIRPGNGTTRPSTRERSSSPTTRETASGRCCRRRRRARPGEDPHICSGRREPGATSRSGPAATSSTRTSTAARSARSASRRANQPPRRSRRAAPTTGSAPLTVTFNGTDSSDPDAGDSFTYAWDLDGDGQYDDSSSADPTHTYTSPGTVTASLRVTDTHGAPPPPR